MGLQRFQFRMSDEALQDRVIDFVANGDGNAHCFPSPRLIHQGTQTDVYIIGGFAAGNENKDRRQRPLRYSSLIKLLGDQLQGLAHVGRAIGLQVIPLELLDRHGALPTCQLAPLENFTALINTSALGFSAAASFRWGSVLRIAKLSDSILLPPIEAEHSTIQMK